MPDLTRTRIVAEARGWIGTPYRHQASLRASAAIASAWCAASGAPWSARSPKRAPPYAPDWAEAASRRAAGRCRRAASDRDRLRSAFRPGDVLLFRWRAHLPAKHAAIVTSRPTMVHAHDGAAVAEVAHRAVVARGG